jgi:hypothetical protein
MSRIARTRALAGYGEQAAAGRAGKESGEEEGQDKSPCHECRKPLTGLADSRAGRSVGSRRTAILSENQRSDMHSAAMQPPGHAP